VGLDNLDGQFDPEEYDATMAALFNDEYYQQVSHVQYALTVYSYCLLER
jgi:capsid portal protein